MNKKILIIEDEEFLVDLYKLKLEKEGYIVLIAYNGEDGLALAKKEAPDLILLDLVMPKVDGYKVLEELKSNEETKDIKVCVLTNLSQYDEKQKAILAKADRYYIKAHITPAQLAEKMEEIFRPN